MSAREPDAQALARLALGNTAPRVWSLLVTIFGDLAREDGQTLRGPVLTAIAGLLSVKSEAVRVALHRLRKDGWIESEKDGRTSQYRLSTMGLAESERASAVIYARDPIVWNHPKLLVGEPGIERNWPSKAVLLGDNLALLDGSGAELLDDVLAVPLAVDCLPDWMSERLVLGELRKECERFHSALLQISSACADAMAIAPVEAAALRTALVHSWRRIKLRAPAVPDPLLANHWKGAECRLLMASVLAKVPRPKL